MKHELKVHPIPFLELRSGAKTCEVRRLDREFKVGDKVLLCEFDPLTQAYTGRDMQRTITHIQEGYGLPDNVGVLSYGDIRFIPAVQVQHHERGSDGEPTGFILQELQDWGLDNLPNGSLLYIRGAE